MIRTNIFTKPKRAQGHVEIIFSFVIFITFLSFLLLFFNPFKTTSNTETYLDLAQNQIEKLITKEVSLISISVTNPTDGCKFFEYDYDGSENIITKNSSGYIYTSSHHEKSGDKYKIYIPFSSVNNFYLIYFSKDFMEQGSCSGGTLKAGSTDYKLGLSRTYSVVSFKELNETFSKNYTGNYSDLKKEIGIPQTKDFALIFYNLSRGNPPILILGKTPEKTIVYSRDVPIQIMYKDGKFEYGFMNIRIW